MTKNHALSPTSLTEETLNAVKEVLQTLIDLGLAGEKAAATGSPADRAALGKVLLTLGPYGGRGNLNEAAFLTVQRLAGQVWNVLHRERPGALEAVSPPSSMPVGRSKINDLRAALNNISGLADLLATSARVHAPISDEAIEATANVIGDLALYCMDELEGNHGP